MSEKQNGRNQAYEIIFDMIMNGDLPAGTVTSTAKLVDQLNIGRSPIRDAILKLDDEGMVKVVPRKGIFITGIYARDIKEMFQLRMAIELFALENLMKIVTKHILKELHVIIDNQEKMASKNCYDSFLDLDEEFHFFIISLLNNKKISDIWEENIKQMQFYGNKGITAHENAVESTNEHRKIINFIEQGDLAKAKEELEQHLNKAKKLVLIG